MEASTAAVDAAKVNFSFTHLASPIDGIAGQQPHSSNRWRVKKEHNWT
jgi:hypothetical protein